MSDKSASTEHDPELDALLGAYVLDALEPEERARVEAYLARNPRAQAEVYELRETTAVLAATPLDDEPASPDLWNRIAAEVEDNAAMLAHPIPDELWAELRAEGLIASHVPTPSAGTLSGGAVAPAAEPVAAAP